MGNNIPRALIIRNNYIIVLESRFRSDFFANHSLFLLLNHESYVLKTLFSIEGIACRTSSRKKKTSENGLYVFFNRCLFLSQIDYPKNL